MENQREEGERNTNIILHTQKRQYNEESRKKKKNIAIVMKEKYFDETILI